MLTTTVRVPRPACGDNNGLARSRYHQEVCRRFAADPAGRAELVDRLEHEVAERQLLLAAMHRWEREQGDAGGRLAGQPMHVRASGVVP